MISVLLMLSAYLVLLPAELMISCYEWVIKSFMDLRISWLLTEKVSGRLTQMAERSLYVQQDVLFTKPLWDF